MAASLLKHPPQTLIEKIVQKYTVQQPIDSSTAQKVPRFKPVYQGEFVAIRPHKVMTHDNTGAVISKFKSFGSSSLYDSKQVVFTLDHDVQNISESNLNKYKSIQEFAKLHNVDFYPAGRGIGHQIMIEEGYAMPYSMVVASDSHANMYGGIGCLGTPIVRTDAAAIWATGQTWWQIPKIIKVELHGKMPPYSTGKDIIVALCGLFCDDQVLNCAIEFVGDGVSSLSVDDRLTISNMTTEWGALAGVFPVDSITIQWIKEQVGRIESIDSNATRRALALLQQSQDYPIAADVGAYYSKHLALDISTIFEYVSGPNSVKVCTPLHQLESNRIPIQKAYLVSCVNSRLSDIHSAAQVLSNRTVAPGVELYIAAASSKIQHDAEMNGDWQTLIKAGAKPLPAGCGPCIGLGVGTLAEGEVGISATNRNYKGRMGSPKALTYLASPAVVAASAATGYICSPRSLMLSNCKVEDPIKPRYFIQEAPPYENQSNTSSETIANRIVSCNVSKVFKAFEGHIVFCDADNLNTDGIYSGKYTYNDDMTPEHMAQVVMQNYDPDFAKIIIKGDILVVGYNFGTGSSREQAATALKHAGICAVVTASVSETFKRNAINNGLPVLECPKLVVDLRKWNRASEKTTRHGARMMVEWEKGTIRVTHNGMHSDYTVNRPGWMTKEILVNGGMTQWVKNWLKNVRI